jgi:hypothetical protein
VVGDALVVAAQERHVDRGLHPVLPLVGEQLGEAATTQLVHDLVVATELDGRLDVAVDDDAAHPADHVLGGGGHLLHRRAQLLRHGHRGHPQARDLGDVDREVTHPLELADHAQRRDDDPQVAGDRLLERQQRERRVVDALAGGVDRLVVADHLLGGVHVAGHQRPGGLAYGDLDLSADLGEVGEDAVELVMESLTHAAHCRHPRRTDVRTR